MENQPKDVKPKIKMYTNINYTGNIPKAKLKGKYLVLLGYVLITGLSLAIVYFLIPKPQSIDSSASVGSQNVWFTFVPESITPDPQTQARPKVVLRKRGGGDVSAVHLEIAYDTRKVTNLTAVVEDWVRGKQPIVLEPFKIENTGSEGFATITLGAPCDQNACYPISNRLQTPLLTLNFTANGSSVMKVTSQTLVTLVDSSENHYSASQTQDLKIN